MLDWILNTPLELHDKNKEKEAFLLIHGNIYIYIYIYKYIHIYIHTYIYICIFEKYINNNNQLSLHGVSWVLPKLQMTIQSIQYYFTSKNEIKTYSS